MVIFAGAMEVHPSGSAGKPLQVRGAYLNRELSWLDFNQRVLELAEREVFPLLERVRFAAIYARNLDEFFMVRVARLYDKQSAGLSALPPDGRSPQQTLDALRARLLVLQERLTRCVEGLLVPALEREGLGVRGVADLEPGDLAQLTRRFREQVFPALTPLAIGLGRHFPYISNLSISLAVLLRDPPTDRQLLARVKVPKELLSRFVRLWPDQAVFLPMEWVIAHHLPELFPGMEVLEYGLFRVTRDAEFRISDDAEDLLRAVETELRQQRFGEVVRLEVNHGMGPLLREPLMEALRVHPQQVYESRGLIGYADLLDLYPLPGFSQLKDKPFVPRVPASLAPTEAVSVMAAMRQGDVLVHHPYESFSATVERFVAEAAADPDVLAIKQTVYRTSDSSPLVPALIQASDRGKQAVCIVELQARFDERTNIQWARRLEESGVHVVYGLPSQKTHAKAILVVRREGERVRHYVHIGTGNYNAKTARLYTDFGLFTTDPDIGADVADLFNYLTGFARPRAFRKLLVAPLGLREGLSHALAQTIEAKRAGQPAWIRMKMNALVDAAIISELYRASGAGVPVELNVRGICCLRPGVPGLSENIRVVSTLGRFLEHSRVYWFQQGNQAQVFLGSADLMPRNLDHRVEVLVPVEDRQLQAVLADVLERCLADDTLAWELDGEGQWHGRWSVGSSRSAQQELMEQASVPAGP